MTSEIGPWLSRLHYQIGRWTPPNLPNQVDMEIVSTMLLPIEQELRDFERRIYDITYPIPGREGRYFEVVRLLFGDLQRVVQQCRDAIQQHLRRMETSWSAAISEMELDKSSILIPASSLSLSEHYYVDVTLSEWSGETVSVPGLISASKPRP
jgi:hypothetical protein